MDIFDIDTYGLAIGALRIISLAIFLVINGLFLFAIHSVPHPVTVMIVNVMTGIGAIANFALWTDHSNLAIGAMLALLLCAMWLALRANEVYSHDCKRTATLHNAWTGIIVLAALMSSYNIGIVSVG